MLKYFTKYFLFFTFFIFLIIGELNAQNQALGTWRVHLPYRNATAITQSDDFIYVGTELSFFTYNKNDGSIERYDKSDGFSDLNIRALSYNENSNSLLVAYENANIDLFKNNQTIINVADIQRATISSVKQVNHIYMSGNLAYLSCNFGIVVLDLEKEEIKDTYIIGENGSQIQIYQVATDDNFIMAATEDGIYQAPINSNNLANFNNWTAQELALSVNNNVKTNGIVAAYGQFHAIVGNQLWSSVGDGSWTVTYDNDSLFLHNISFDNQRITLTEWGSEESSVNARLVLLDQNFEPQYFKNGGLGRPLQSIFSSDNQLWVADLYNGLVNINQDNAYQRVIPNGPNSNKVFALATRNGELWATSGGVNNTWLYQFIDAGFYRYNNNTWDNFNNFNTDILYLKDMRDFIALAYHPTENLLYLASYGWGLLEYDYETFTLFDPQNSSLQETTGDPGRYRISGLDFDFNNNLWISNFGAAAPISVKMANGEWQAFTPPMPLNENGVFGIITDDFGQKWMPVKRDGLLVFDSGNDLKDTSDDSYALLKIGEGRGNLPSNDVRCIAKDRDGHIWVGTDQGVGVFYCAFNVFGQGGCDAIKPFVEVDGFGAYLLETEIIRTIAVDGANRKWIGTENGVWLMSPDGTQQINYFTVENSPLLSNEITDISIDAQTAEVFIGTSRGIVSFQAAATEATNLHNSEILVYPNPVRPDYIGDIAIKGLAQDATVKITDVNGTLFYETTALGGQAVWDGKDYNGQQASSGVYLIFSSNSDGSDSAVTKLLLTR